MTSVNKYIAILLWGSYLVPFCFQQIHIMWHCSQKHSDRHVEWRSGNANESEAAFAPKGHRHCPICDYKFTVTKTPENYISESRILVTIGHFHAPVIARPYQNFEVTKTPRAPPFPILP